jgi:SM-20-related protein
LFRPEWSVHADTGIAERYRAMASDIRERGWSEQLDFLSAALTHALEAECRVLASAGALKPAQIGKGAARVCRPDVRGDCIRWIKPGQSAACNAYLAEMGGLRFALNRDLRAGLGEYEGHFAWYAPGTFYVRHRDRFRDDDSRIVTVIAYLNDTWEAEQGGALRLHTDDGGVRDIAPIGGRVVVFLSGDIEHEVLPATRERISLAGWFTRRL